VTIDWKNNIHGVIDTTGQLLKKKTAINSWNITGEFHEGIARFSYSFGPYSYDGFINIQGDTILDDSNYKAIYDFSCGRAIAIDKEGNFFVLDRHGKKVINQSFDFIPTMFFKNYTIAVINDRWGIIDTNARFIVPPLYDQISFPDSTVDYFFFGKSDDNDKFSYRHGVANINNQVIIQPVMEYYKKQGFVNGLLSATVDNRETLLNKKGQIVWQELINKEEAASLLNIDYMGNSAYRDYTDTVIKLNTGDSAYVALQGKRITAADHLPNNKFIFQFDTAQNFSQNGYKAYQLIVGNSTNEAIKLLRISGLIILLEAQDEDSVWKKIEIIGFPTHTNGYDDIVLNPGIFWPFTVARYGGSFSTKLRAALWYLDKKGKIQTIYSNSINTNINRTQFWREYDFPQGVYDPHRWNKSVDLSTIKRDDYGNLVFPDYP
jgi:hypothetical protein